MLKDIFNKKRHYATIAQPPRRQERRPAATADQIPEGLFNKCPTCGALLMSKELQKHAHTCPSCGHHFPVGAQVRIELTLDAGSFVEEDAGVTSVNPLAFPEYEAKLAKAQQATALLEGAVTGCGTIGGFQARIGVMDPRFIMGSMGSAVGEKLTRAMERACAERVPLVLFTASGGARMQEGVLSLMQMAKTSVALERMHEAGVLFVTVITHPTTGGVSASFASLGDIILAEPGAMFGFAGRRVIEQTIRQTLPDDFQTAEFVLKHGMIDKVVHRMDLRDTLTSILRMHAAGGVESGR
ncbi:MAG: acetyl-CoA carboxylase, carboxyltransferase subunit beta [Alicyclobacillus sp.]|nr:acetyl-CoA carboxylase, carboxyltransferase subunit beta [Alicyclobacillus sp.]